MKEEKVPVKFSYAGIKYEIIGSKFKPSGLKNHILRFVLESPKNGTVIVLYINKAGEYHWQYPSQPNEDHIASIIVKALLKQESHKK